MHPPAGRSLRLRFALVGSQLHLLRREPRAMRALPSQPLPERPGSDDRQQVTGHWIELRDADDRLLYRRVLHDPLGRSIEVRTGGSWRRTAVTPRATFSVTVPHLENASSFTFHGPAPDDPFGPSRRLGAFDLARSGARNG